MQDRRLENTEDSFRKRQNGADVEICIDTPHFQGQESGVQAIVEEILRGWAHPTPMLSRKLVNCVVESNKNGHWQ